MPRLPGSHLSSRQSARLVEHFVAGTPARTTAELLGVNRNTARLFYHRLRELIARRLEEASPIDHSGRRQEAPFEAHAPLLALFKRDGKVYTAPVHAGGQPDALIYDATTPPHAAVSIAGLRLRRAEHARHSPMDAIDNFWSQTERHLRRYNGIPRQHLLLFLKECEWRFNYGSPAQLLETLVRWIGSAPPR